MSGSILTINAGSSSLKFALFDSAAALTETVRGEIENLGAAPWRARNDPESFSSSANSASVPIR